jgi:hypothetical protein
MKIGRSLLWDDREIEAWERSLPRRRRSEPAPDDFPEAADEEAADEEVDHDKRQVA